MAEVGLLPFARIALQVSRAVLPRYRSRFSKHQFTQPQLLAILCLMRYEDWTFREAEVRLSEHRELRQALGLVSVPDFTTLYRFLAAPGRPDHRPRGRRDGAPVARFARHGRKRARVAVDATGLAQGAVSTFFVRRMHHHGQKPLPWRHWLKWVVVVDLDQQFVLSQIARRGPWNDCANLPAVVEAASAANAHRAGAGRRRVRQREESHLHPATTRGAERDSRQARKENLAHTWSARRDAAGIPATALPPPRPDREPVLFGQTQTLGSCAGSLAAHADASSPAARIEFQSVSLETSPPFLRMSTEPTYLINGVRKIQINSSGAKARFSGQFKVGAKAPTPLPYL